MPSKEAAWESGKLGFAVPLPRIYQRSVPRWRPAATQTLIRNLARLLAHLSRWLADHQGAGDLTRETIDRFVRARRAAGYTAHRCASSLEDQRVTARGSRGLDAVVGRPFGQMQHPGAIS